VTAPRDRSARLVAVALLASVLDRGLNLSETGAEDMPTDPRDRAFARHLAYGVLRWLGALEWLAGHLLQRPIKTRDRDVHRLLLIGLFQLWQDETAAHAAIHEAAESARHLGKPWAVALINAVLRRFQREREPLLARLAASEESLAHPAWLLDRLRMDWPSDWETITIANNHPAPLWLRLAPDADRAKLEGRLRDAGFRFEAHPNAPAALAIRPAVATETIPGFAEGLMSVQDPAAQLAAPLLQLEPGLRVLDACCAPGGKTCHILELEPNIELTALDRSPERLERVRENLERLGLASRPGLRLLAADAAEPDEWWDGEAFHRILLDAPCSATGVIRRHPEIKWLRTPQQVAEAVQLQARLLERLWPRLEPGGILLYATCSVLRDENDRQIEQFVAQRVDAEWSVLNAAWGRELGHGRQVLPGERDMDGFFYARLRKS
jgi:16S rRNA (cytosine967-C5)-methyltransferase